MSTRLLPFFLLGGLLLTTGNELTAQHRVYISSSLLLRRQAITTWDPGGYFIADRYAQRITYDFGVEVAATNRLSVISGAQRIFFVEDVNFWSGVAGYTLLIRNNPQTGIQIPLGVRFSLVRNTSPSRWRIGAQGGINVAFVEGGSGTQGGGLVSGSLRISSNSTFRIVQRHFAAFDAGIFAKYRVSNRVNLMYTYSYVYSLAERISIMETSYQVSRGGTTEIFHARTAANGSASLHGLGLQFALVR